MFGAEVVMRVPRLLLKWDSSRILRILLQSFGQDREKIALRCVRGIGSVVQPARCGESIIEEPRARDRSYFATE